MKLHLPSIALALLAAALVAGGCRDLSNQGQRRADAGGSGDGDGGAQEGLTIQDVQSDEVSVGDPVTLREVVVVAVDTYGSRRGSVYVMDPEGGPYSGVLVFLNGTQAAGLSPGDLIDVEGGVKAEFSFDDDDSDRSLTQIVEPSGSDITLTKVGSGEVPEPEIVDPAVLASDDEEAEKWESVLISIEEVAIESGPRQIGSDETRQEVRVTGPMLVVTDLAALPEDAEVGTCFASMTGILSYAFDYQMLPRGAEDYVADEEACPPPPEAVTVREIQEQVEGEEGINEGDSVSVEAAVVTAVELNDGGDPIHIYIQDQVGEPQLWNGVYVWQGDDPAPLSSDLDVGSLVDVQASVGDYRNATQLESGAAVTLLEGSAEPVIFVDPPLADLASVASGEPYEGVLVELTNVKVKEGVNQFGEFVVTDGTDVLIVDDSLHAHEPEVDDCFAMLRGVMSENDFGEDGNRVLLPRSADDIVDGGDCNFD